MLGFIRQWWKKRALRKARENWITDEMRDKSIAVRRLQAQVSSLEKQVMLKARLESLDAAIAGSGSSKWEERLAMGLIDKFLTPQIQGTKKSIAQGMGQEKTSVTDEEIENFIKNNAHLIAECRDLNLTENEILYEVHNRAPHLDDDSVRRTAALIKKEVDIHGEN